MSNEREITKTRVLVVEGKYDKEFFSHYLKHLGIPDVDIRHVNGKSEFKNKLPSLVSQSGFRKNVDYFAIIRDADDSSESAFQSISNILTKIDGREILGKPLEPPVEKEQFSSGEPKVAIYIMPGNSDKGMLEDLFFSTINSDDPALKCTNDYMNCISDLEENPKNVSKARAQVYLASKPKLTCQVGYAAGKGYWDFDSKELNGLKNFLENLR